MLWKRGNLITVIRGRGASPVKRRQLRLLSSPPCRIVMSMVFNVSDDFGKLLLEGWVCQQSRLSSFESFSYFEDPLRPDVSS